MLGRLLLTVLAGALWLGLRRVRAGGRAALLVAVLRGGALGLTVALAGALVLTQTAGKMGQSPHYFALMSLGLSMVFVSFGSVGALLLTLQARRSE